MPLDRPATLLIIIEALRRHRPNLSLSAAALEAETIVTSLQEAGWLLCGTDGQKTVRHARHKCYAVIGWLPPGLAQREVAPAECCSAFHRATYVPTPGQPQATGSYVASPANERGPSTPISSAPPVEFRAPARAENKRPRR